MLDIESKEAMCRSDGSLVAQKDTEYTAGVETSMLSCGDQGLTIGSRMVKSPTVVNTAVVMNELPDIGLRAVHAQYVIVRATGEPLTYI